MELFTATIITILNRKGWQVSYMKTFYSCFKIISVLICIALLFSFTGCKKPGTEKIKTITIGSKNFTEQEILGEILAILIEEKTDIKVNRKFNLGGTMVCFNALKTGDLDLYAEYTGTGLVNILKMKAEKDPEKTYQTVKKHFLEKFNMVWLKPFGFNNTYALSMRKGHAQSLGIKKISDLAAHKETIETGFTAEFMQRPDGYPGLTKHYDFEFDNRPRQMDPGLMYKAAAEKAVDLISAFATDGRIPAYGLTILEDDKQFFPPYYAAPLLKRETLQRYPEIKDMLNTLSGVISDDAMQKMNYEVDEKEKNPADVARSFLISMKLI
jgi:osmoprotectant transport system substrate-binding protein